MFHYKQLVVFLIHYLLESFLDNLAMLLITDDKSRVILCNILDVGLPVLPIFDTG